MSTPIALPTDLQTFLGADTIDAERAAALLEAAQANAETIVTPLPVDAKWIVVQAAARAYASPMGSGDLMLGSGRIATYGKGQAGVYLTRGEKSELRLLAGRGSAFSADTLDPAYTLNQPWWDSQGIADGPELLL